MHRLDALLELLGPDWITALGSDMTRTTFRFLAAYGNPHQVKRLGRARLVRWFQRQTRKARGPEHADKVVAAAEATLALALTEQIAKLDVRILDLYCETDPDQIVLSAPGVGKILAGQIRGRLGDPHRSTSLAAARSFSGLVPKLNASESTTPSVVPPRRATHVCVRRCSALPTTPARPTLSSRPAITG